MALEIGAGITLGGGISLTVESGGGGNPNLFTVGDGKTVSITTSSGGADHLTIVTIGEQSVVANWASTASLSKTGASGSVTFDILNDFANNGDGTYTYDFYVPSIPQATTWESIEFA